MTTKQRKFRAPEQQKARNVVPTVASGTWINVDTSSYIYRKQNVNLMKTLPNHCFYASPSPSLSHSHPLSLSLTLSLTLP